MSIAAWNEYSDQSDFENEEKSQSPNQSLITEATRLIFLRKYSQTNLPEDILINIFEENGYDDTSILQEIEKKINQKEKYYTIVEKPTLKSIRKNNCSSSYNYMNNKKCYYYSNSYNYNYSNNNSGNNKYYKAFHKKKTRNNFYKNRHDMAIEKKQDLEELVYTEPKDESFSKKSTRTSLEKQSSKEIISSPAEEETKTSFSPKNFVRKNFIQKTINNIPQDNKKYYPSKLFPGVFFDTPIEDPQEKCWNRVIQYYATIENM